jgi:hypothetical protein
VFKQHDFLEPKFEHLLLNIPKDVSEAFENKNQQYIDTCDALNTTTLRFAAFGTDEIRLAGAPPDAFAQLAMQLAQFRSNGNSGVFMC